VKKMLVYVLLNVDPSKEHLVYNRLTKDESIKDVYPLFGEYDILVEFDAPEKENIGTVVQEKILSLDGVLATKTLTGMGV